MSVETTNVSKQRILKSLKYLVLTVAISIGATGISNAETFTVTADVGCDPMMGMDTGAMINSITATVDSEPVVGDTIDLGSFNVGEFKDIIFTIDADGNLDCALNETDATILIEYTDSLVMDALSSAYDDYGFPTSETSVTVTFVAPSVLENLAFNESITFSIVS